MDKEKSTLTIEKVLEISAAVDLVSSNDTLDGRVSYWLGRLGDYCSAPIKVFNKEKDKIQKQVVEKQEPLTVEVAKLDKEKDKNKIVDLNSQINKLNEEFTDKIKALLEQEEDMIIPDFKLADFTAKEDTVRLDKVEELDEKGNKVTKKIEVKIKKGQSLVPVRFYKLMGEYIKE
jgi:hypothetical protein